METILANFVSQDLIDHIIMPYCEHTMLEYDIQKQLTYLDPLNGEFCCDAVQDISLFNPEYGYTNRDIENTFIAYFRSKYFKSVYWHVKLKNHGRFIKTYRSRPSNRIYF
jgi:hypothetical protein